MVLLKIGPLHYFPILARSLAEGMIKCEKLPLNITVNFRFKDIFGNSKNLPLIENLP